LQSAFREAAGVFAVNPEIAESCRSFTKAVHVIPSGFDASRFEDSRALDDTDGIFRILFPGLIDEYMKGFHVIREACQQLWLERQDFELHVTADESANCDLPFIRARGWQSQQDLPGLMSACDVVVVPTIAQEALGRTAVEAMGAERPVIASRIGGLPYTVTENETGLLVEPGDAADLKRAIVRLMTDTPFAVQLGGNGRRRFLSEFTWDAVIQNKYRPLFRALRSSR
jgi:glycosyltransferase involved in cell wall biosynthesis